MKRRGVARILEAIFSAILIIEAVSIGYVLVKTSNPSIIKSSEELHRLGYSILSSIASNNGLDRLIFDEEWNIRSGWESDLKVIVSSLLPQNIIFNITIYNASIDENGFVRLEKLNRVPITNVYSENAFTHAGENVLVSYVYTSYNPIKKDIVILFIYMRLAILRSV